MSERGTSGDSGMDFIDSLRWIAQRPMREYRWLKEGVKATLARFLSRLAGNFVMLDRTVTVR